jgi:ATP-dependent RNA helicase DeaD
MPKEDDVAETRVKTLLDDVRRTIEGGGIEPYIRMVERGISGDTTTLEIAAALVKMRMEQAGSDTKVADEVPDFGDTGAEPGMVRFFIALGRDHNVTPKDIVGAIAGETGIPGKSIGAIRTLDSYSFVEIPRDRAGEVYSIMKDRTIRGQLTGIEPAKGHRE